MNISKVVLTGGPCAGKTTGLAYLAEKLSDRGLWPIIVPESATLLMQGNVLPSSHFFSSDRFQRAVIETASDLEKIYGRLAEECSHKRPVVICDRGIPDAAAYTPSERYAQILEELHLGSPVEVRDGRYQGAVHLRSAACGAAEFYSTASNPHRRETLEEAVRMDAATQGAWIGHPHLRIVENGGDFSQKLRALDRHVCRIFGIPTPVEIERKYLCRPLDPFRIPEPKQRIEIEQCYLISSDPDTVLRVRKRGQNGSFVYFETIKREISPGTRFETERFITEAEYQWALRFRDPRCRVIRKERFCFVYEGQYLEFDRIRLPDKMLYLLEIELTELSDKISLPPWLPIVEEVTDDDNYSNWSLSQQK